MRGAGEFAMAEQIRKILMQEQDHQIDLATALGIEVPNVNRNSAPPHPGQLARSPSASLSWRRGRYRLVAELIAWRS